MKRRGLSTAGRHVLLSGIGVSFACLLIAGSAGADPGTSIPDTGSRPAAGGVVSLPGHPTGAGGTQGPTGTVPAAGSPATTNLVLGPLATQVMTESREIELLGERSKQADDNAKTARRTANDAQQALETARAKLAEQQSRADSAAAEAYKHAVGLGPFSRYASQLHNLSSRSAAMPRQPGGSGEAVDAARATAEVLTADRTYQETESMARSMEAASASIAAEYQQRSTALEELKSRNAAEMALADAQRDAYEQSVGGGYTGDIAVDGSGANSKALDAVRFALAQLGKPYVWATEGPNTYDCSGLVLAAYQSVGASLPRIANTQYHSTTPVTAGRTVKGDLLVPGDLLFFSTNPSNWVEIHHVGIYIGGGRMVHAPHTGDVVKISPVWWSEFFGATRVFPAAVGPAPLPGPAPIDHSGLGGSSGSGQAPGSSEGSGPGATGPGSTSEAPGPGSSSSSTPAEPSSPATSEPSQSPSKEPSKEPSPTPAPTHSASTNPPSGTPSGASSNPTGDQHSGESGTSSSSN